MDYLTFLRYCIQHQFIHAQQRQQDSAAPCLDFLIFTFFFAVLQTLYEPEILVFDIMGIRLNNQLSLWCVYKQLRQIVLIVPLSNRTVLHLYFLHFT